MNNIKNILLALLLLTLMGCNSTETQTQSNPNQENTHEQSDTIDYKSQFINKANCHQIIENEFIHICYDHKLKAAKSVAYTLDGDLMNDPNIEKRPSFYTEKSIDKRYRISTTDYINSGYDRGHLAPDAAFDWSDESLNAVYTLANIIPQAPQVNRNMWSQIEKFARDKAVELGELNVINVVKYGKQSKRIGKNKMAVSRGFYKVLYNDEQNYKECFYYANKLNLTSRNDEISKHDVNCNNALSEILNGGFDS
jgi:endonuclease G